MKVKVSMPWQIIISLVLAVVSGLLLPSLATYTAWMGVIFLRALKMIVAPLILMSIISGIGKLNSGKDFGRLGFKTMSYYIATTLVAIITGLFLVNLFKPGLHANLGFTKATNELNVSSGTLSDNLLRIVPENIFKALAETDMLAIIFIAMIFGFAITTLNDPYKASLNRFFEAGNQLVMRVTEIIIKFSPLGIFGIVIRIVSEQNNLPELVYRMGFYMFVVVLGLIIHGMIIMPLLLKLAANINPLKHIRAVLTPLLTAFSTSSSNATLPLTMDAMEKKAGVSVRISSFTLPLGATVNMNGTALYEIVAALFIAQAYGIHLTIDQQIIAVFMALLASIGAAGIPMAGMVTMGMVLTAVGLPLEGIGLILAVDRLLDMGRTMINVWGDTCVCAIIAKSEGENIYP